MTSLRAGDHGVGVGHGSALVTSDLGAVERTASVVSIGFFDGVHLGHRSIIAGALEHATARGVRSVVVTFDRHPMQIIRPDQAPPLLMTTARRAATLAASGVDLVVVLAFDEHRRSQPPEEFVDQVLRSVLDVRHLVVGRNFRFGHRAAGDVALLERLGARDQFGVEGVDLLSVDGEPVSSTRIRAALADADIGTATRLLGQPFVIDGTVVHGNHRGRGLGFPTANLEVDPHCVIPAAGVYAGVLTHPDGRDLPAVTSIGTNPQFDGAAVSVESHVLDVDEDLYGLHVAVDLRHSIRAQQRFASVDDLVVAMHADIDVARGLFAAADDTPG